MALTVVGGRGPSLGDFVRQRRMALGLSQDQLARRCDLDEVNQKWVSRLENNVKELPTPEQLTALAVALETTVDELLRHAGYPVGGAVDDVFADPDARLLVSQYGRLDDRKKDVIRRTIREFSDMQM